MKLTRIDLLIVREGRDHIAAEIKLLEAGGSPKHAHDLKTLRQMLAAAERALRQNRRLLH